MLLLRQPVFSLEYPILDIFCKYQLAKQVSAFPILPSYARSITWAHHNLSLPFLVTLFRLRVKWACLSLVNPPTMLVLLICDSFHVRALDPFVMGFQNGWKRHWETSLGPLCPMYLNLYLTMFMFCSQFYNICFGNESLLHKFHPYFLEKGGIKLWHEI